MVLSLKAQATSNVIERNAVTKQYIGFSYNTGLPRRLHLLAMTSIKLLCRFDLPLTGMATMKKTNKLIRLFNKIKEAQRGGILFLQTN
jgi:hypothetical protein